MSHDNIQGFCHCFTHWNPQGDNRKKKPLSKNNIIQSNAHSFTLLMLEFISKHTLILIHRNMKRLELQRLNLTFFIVLHPLLQGFGSTGQAKLLVKLQTWNEIAAFRLVLSEQHHNENHWVLITFFFFNSEKKKKKICIRFFLVMKKNQENTNYWWFFFL